MAAFQHQVLVFAILLAAIAMPVKGQSSTAICTGAMIRNFSPCIGFLTSGSNTSSPTSACCDSLKSLMSNGQDCLCQIITGGTSLQIPMNRAMFLPRACKTSGVPIECKAVASPVPAPGSPGQGGSNTYPGLLTPPSGGSIIPQTPSPPSSTPGVFTNTPTGQQGDVAPTLTPPGMRPTLTLSAANTSRLSLSSLLVAVFGAILLNCY